MPHYTPEHENPEAYARRLLATSDASDTPQVALAWAAIGIAEALRDIALYVGRSDRP